MNKKDHSETDIKEKYITPAITKSDWDEQDTTWTEIFITYGRIYVKGKIAARRFPSAQIKFRFGYVNN
ncbi:MAG: hypothetical protein ABI402_17480 [Ferruginibacter sp.]